MKSCRKHLESLLFRRHPGQHGDVHTIANYNKLPSELHRRRSHTVLTMRNCTRTGFWEDIVSKPGVRAFKDSEEGWGGARPI